MSGIIETLLRADAGQRLYACDGDWVTAGQVRAMSGHALARARGVGGPLFLHTASASRFLAGLLAGAAAGKAVAMPAHAQANYLNELGCAPEALFTDTSFEGAGGDDALVDADSDPLLLLFTSGSTSAPKRVEKSLSRLEIESRVLESLWGEQAGHVVATVSHQHIYGLLFRIVWPLLSGRTADDMAATYWENLEGRLAGATLISSPAHLTRLPPRSDLFTPAPALIFSSGQLLTADAAKTCAIAFGKPVLEVFGSTETGGIAWRRQAIPDAPWTPLPGVSVSIDADNALSVRSPHLQDDAPLRTGDAAILNPDQSFQLQPRGDRVVKIDGKRVSLTRVEDALLGQPSIAAAAALTLPARRGALGAIVALTAEGRARLDEAGAFRFSRQMRAAIATQLEPPERPKHWRFVEAIPTDSQGKRPLADLRALFSAADPLDQLELDIRRHDEGEAEIAFTLPPELIFFQGHFPEHAILPGVAQAHLAVLIAHKLWGAWPADANLARLKFRRILVPGNAIVLKLKRNAASGRILFVYMLGDIAASEGEIGGESR